MENEISGTNWQRLNDVFAAAVELHGPGREQFLEDADPHVRDAVEQLLAAKAEASELSFFERDVLAVHATRVLEQQENAPSLPATQIGNYHLVRELGHGGMGAVYLAEREHFRQQVAIKIIRRGMDTDEIIRRFHRERQVLANLNHPHIARLLDGGTTNEGLPFFVMEFVKGVPITDFCDQRKLSIRERLLQFQKICSAVSYIHENAVVHRDIKSSNILVNEDGDPKLLDFGIAKLLASNGDERTLTQTSADLRLFTPEYASPEQLRGETITIASDIYSLGVLLYELLTGHRPFCLKEASPIEMLKIVAEQEPAAPSNAVCASQIITPDKLRQRLRGDLDNITLKALRKEPGHRYETVAQLSEDIRRHLNSLPITARPATIVYRAAKLVRRQRTTLWAAAVLVVLTITAQIGLSVFLWPTLDGDDYAHKVSTITPSSSIAVLPFEDATLAKDQLTVEQRKKVKKRYTDNAEAYTLYLKGKYAASQQSERSLKQSVQYFNQALDLDPGYALAHAGIADAYSAMAAVYLSPHEAIPKMKAAALLALELDPELAEARVVLALALSSYDWNWPAADAEFERAIELNPNYATARHWYARHLAFQGRYAEAQAQFKRARELDPLGPYITLDSNFPDFFAGNYDRAIEQINRAIELDDKFWFAYWVRGWAREEKGDVAGAIADYRKAQSVEDSDIIRAFLAHAFAVLGRRREARKILSELLKARNDRYIGAPMTAAIYAGLGDNEEALKWLEKGYEDRDEWMIWLKFDHRFGSLRHDPRFQNLLQRVGLVAATDSAR